MWFLGGSSDKTPDTRGKRNMMGGQSVQAVKFGGGQLVRGQSIGVQNSHLIRNGLDPVSKTLRARRLCMPLVRMFSPLSMEFLHYLAHRAVWYHCMCFVPPGTNHSTESAITICI